MLLFQYQESQEKKQILDDLVTFLYRRSLIDPNDYVGAYSSLKGDRATARNDLKHAKALLGAVRRRTWITESDILEHTNGRLTYNQKDQRWEYTVGQLFGTEYRGSVCSLLASVLLTAYMKEGKKREEVREHLKKEIGRSVAKRWFN